MPKRIFDLVFATILLVTLSPLLIVLSLIILLTIGRPILFKQKRAGLNGKPFTLLKFRTMDNAADAVEQDTSDIERTTRIGAILRKTSLDELPELINVMMGDMSFVGPRPLLLEYLPLYTPEQARRHDVLPGITGWAQINGRNSLSWADKFKLDVWYIDNRSDMLDLKIILCTLFAVVARRGVNQSESLTMPKFVGNVND